MLDWGTHSRTVKLLEETDSYACKGMLKQVQKGLYDGKFFEFHHEYR